MLSFSQAVHAASIAFRQTAQPIACNKLYPLGGEMLRNIGPIELLIILVIVILIFGVGRVSEIGAALGKSIREFRREIRKSEEEPETKEKDTQGEKDTQEEE